MTVLEESTMIISRGYAKNYLTEIMNIYDYALSHLKMCIYVESVFNDTVEQAEIDIGAIKTSWSRANYAEQLVSI